MRIEQVRIRVQRSNIVPSRLLCALCFLFIVLSILGCSLPSFFLQNASGQTTYQVAGTCAILSTSYHVISGVRSNDVVLVIINPSTGSRYYSAIFYSNLTLLQETVEWAYQPVYGSHSYQFIANETGNYLLKIWGDIDNPFNYTVSCSHQISIDR
jgi:hypothetical protein